MRQEQTFNDRSGLYLGFPSAVRPATRDRVRSMPGMQELAGRLPRQLVLGLILIIALVAFEIFNFDTTRYALNSLLGEVGFLGFSWAAILAVAFCAIDFAGLAHLFTPERGRQEPKEVWYLMGAWLLGATMNAIMTWWAISLTLLNHDFGNEVLGREQLLTYVPVFVAVLVWLTRILFIGAISVAGDHLFNRDSQTIGYQRGDQPPMVAQPERRPLQQPALSQVSFGATYQDPLAQSRPARDFEQATVRRPVPPGHGRQPGLVAARGRRR
jgi:hypothetical protein